MRNKRNRVMQLIALSQIIFIGLDTVNFAFAETSSVQETTETSSTLESSTLKSSEKIAAPVISSDQQPPSSYSKEPDLGHSEKQEVVNDHEISLLEGTEAHGATPVIHFENKQLENQIAFEGSLFAGSENKESKSSETTLRSLCVQRMDEKGEWQTQHTFPVTDSGESISNQGYFFNYEMTEPSVGSYRYRLAVEYTIDWYAADSLAESNPVKASFELGTATIEEPEQAIVEETIPVEESTIDDSSEKEVSKASVEEEVKDSSLEKMGSEEVQIEESVTKTNNSLPTLSTSQLIRPLADNYRHAFQRGLGIMPLASAEVTPITSNPYQSSEAENDNILSVPSFVSAKYTSSTRVEMVMRFDWQFVGYVSPTAMTEDQMKEQMDKRPYAYHVTLGDTTWGHDAIIGIVAKGHMKKDEGTCNHGELTAFSNSRRTVQGYSSGAYHLISANTSIATFSNVPVKETVTVGHHFVLNNKHASASVDLYFDQLNADLNSISRPVIIGADGVTENVTMAQGSYQGDISNVLNDGSVNLSLNGGSTWSTAITNLVHTSTKGGTYGKSSGEKLSGLKAGKEYRVKVRLKNWIGEDWRESPVTTFYTPNETTKKPEVKSQTDPTGQNDAAVTLAGDYVVESQMPAHAKSVEAQVSLDGSNWTTKTPGCTVDETNRTVTYTLSGLDSYTAYHTRFRVKNDSGHWSAWSPTATFTTKSVPLKVGTPVISKAASTYQLDSGQYTGHISTNASDANSGHVRYSSDNGVTWKDYPKTLGHTTSLNGQYDGMNLTGLTSGSEYRLQVGLKDADRVYVYSDTTRFFTVNAVDPLNVSNLVSPNRFEASADFTGIYQTGETPANPDDFEVEIKVKGDPSWSPMNNGTTPMLENASIDTSTNQVKFTGKKMKPSTVYDIRYRVKNAGGWSDWATSSEFTTATAAPAMFIMSSPTFDFGMLNKESFIQQAGLSSTSKKEHVVVDNTVDTKGWKLTAQLSQL